MSKPKYRPGHFCEVCKKPLLWAQTRPSIIKMGRGRFCSYGCMGDWQAKNRAGKNSPCWKGGKIEKVCEVCDKTFLVARSTIDRGHGRFCSPKCNGVWCSNNLSGENSHLWKGGKIEKECGICNEVFWVKPSEVVKGWGRFCSNKCRGMWHSSTLRGESHFAWRGGEIEQRCEICDIFFFAKRSEVAKGYGRFCSRKCYHIGESGKNNHGWKGGDIEKKCENCDEFFFAKRGQAGRFCSYECKGRWDSQNRVGENSTNWQGGISFHPYPPTFNAQFKRKIRARDGQTCALCGNGGRCVHHINYTKDDTTPENCITLCRSCHGKTGTNREHWQAVLTEIAELTPQEYING